MRYDRSKELDGCGMYLFREVEREENLLSEGEID